MAETKAHTKASLHALTPVLGVTGMVIAVIALNFQALSHVESEYSKQENARVEQRLQDLERMKVEKEHNRQLDIEAQKVIDNASPVTIRIMDASPALDACRTVTWLVPANVVQKAKTEQATPISITVTTYSELQGKTGEDDVVAGDYARTRPVVETDFGAAHDYIVSHPELVPVIEQGCKAGIPEGAFPVDSDLFPKGTVAMDLPY